jgi:hypothetical protein
MKREPRTIMVEPHQQVVLSQVRVPVESLGIKVEVGTTQVVISGRHLVTAVYQQDLDWPELFMDMDTAELVYLDLSREPRKQGRKPRRRKPR